MKDKIKAKIAKPIYVDLIKMQVPEGSSYECDICYQCLLEGDIMYANSSILTIVCPECAEKYEVKE
jgi:hypothetical protein